MGFYGNISNLGKTNMTFDKIYSNRLFMDSQADSDGVYLGRYALVEYSQTHFQDTFISFYLDDDGNKKADANLNVDLQLVKNKGYAERSLDGTYQNKFYLCQEKNGVLELTLLKNLSCYSLIIIENAEEFNKQKQDLFIKDIASNSFISCLNQDYNAENDYYILRNNYALNYDIDLAVYNETYDSTVWIKQYENDKAKYFNIAELNSAVPTFQIFAEPPREVPIAPFFSADSNNLHYNLHVGSPWGFKPGVLYYNEAAFNPQIQIYDKDNKLSFNINKKDEQQKDELSITTASSNQYYYTYDKENNHQTKEQSPDIQELNIQLPSIGNMMSDIWDMVYGPYRDINQQQWMTMEQLEERFVDDEGKINELFEIYQGDESNHVQLKGTSQKFDFSSLSGRLQSLSDMEANEQSIFYKDTDGKFSSKNILDFQIIGYEPPELEQPQTNQFADGQTIQQILAFLDSSILNLKEQDINIAKDLLELSEKVDELEKTGGGGNGGSADIIAPDGTAFQNWVFYIEGREEPEIRQVCIGTVSSPEE